MFQRATALIAAVLLGAATLAALLQDPAFEVVSVKASAPGATGRKGGGRGADPGLFTWHNRPLRALILYAYDIADYQLAGAPTWVAEERFDIDAKPAAPATDEQELAMVRTLLASRFQLKAHRETRPLEAYAMTVATNGPKFGPQFHKVDEAGLRTEMSNANPDAGVFMGGTMNEFAALLRMNMRTTHPADWPFSGDGPPILDQTGLDGLYSITVRHPGYQGDFAAAAESQLGLKLTLRKIPVEMLVIDSVARPTEN